MRHRVHGRKLGRTSAHRKALFRNQLTALFTHERIVTTVAKAKELRPIAERMVTIARTGTLAARRKVATMVQDKEIARRLFDEIAPRFADRPGGYTRIMRLGRRHGDNAELAIIEFVDYELAEHQDGGEKEAKGSFLDRAKGVFGGGAAADETASAADDAIEAAEVEDDVEAIEAEVVADEPVDEVVEAEVEVDEVAEEPTTEEPVEIASDETIIDEPAAAEGEPEAKADHAAGDADEEKDEKKNDA